MFCDYLGYQGLMENEGSLEFLGRGARWVGRVFLVILGNEDLQASTGTQENWEPQVLLESLDSLVTWALLDLLVIQDQRA